MPLAELVNQLDRYYPGIILLRDEALAARRVTGLFNLGNPVAALKTAASTQRAEVTEFGPYLLLVTAP